jgi:hypothetical protein
MHDTDNLADAEREQGRDMEGEVWLGASARSLCYQTHCSKFAEDFDHDQGDNGSSNAIS